MGAVDIAAALAASRRAVRLYPPEHPTHREALAGLVSAVQEAVEVRPLALNLRNGRLHEGSEVLTEASPATRALVEAMEARRVESLTFHLGFGEVDATGLSEVLSLRPSPDLQVQAELDAREVRAVTVSELEDTTSREAEERDRRREADRALYRRSLAALTEITTALVEGGAADPAPAVRALAQLIERVSDEPYAILALATMTGHGERSRFHAVSVMLHALVLANALGLSDRELLAVGLAGLLHDVGKSLSLPGGADGVRLGHPVAGAQALGAMPDEDCAAMIVAYEHHMGADGSGWPERDDGYRTHPYTAIVAVADRYDNLVRPAEDRLLRPNEAAAQLLREASGGLLDPVVTRVFVNLIGVIPVGCTVRLSDHSVGIVRAPADDPLRPQIRLVLGPDGAELRPAPDVDMLGDERVIVDVLASGVLGLHAADHL